MDVTDIERDGTHIRVSVSDTAFLSWICRSYEPQQERFVRRMNRLGVEPVGSINERLRFRFTDKASVDIQAKEEFKAVFIRTWLQSGLEP